MNTTLGLTAADHHPGRWSSRSASVGRFNTIPTAPSAVCSTTSTTVRAKLGSAIPGIATTNCPANDVNSSIIGTHRPSPAGVPPSSKVN